MDESRDRNAVLDEQEIKAILMVQSIISRMADNSQRCKNYFLTSCAAVTVFLGGKIVEHGWKFFSVFLLITLCFWYQDARYLQLERKFRQHHKAIVDGTVNYLEQWDINLKQYKESFLSCAFSFSEILFYPLFAIVVALIVFYLP